MMTAWLVEIENQPFFGFGMIEAKKDVIEGVAIARVSVKIA